MDPREAENEYVRCVFNCSQNVQNIRERQTLIEDKARAEAVKRLLELEPDIVFKRWKTYERWEQWMAEQRKVKHRQDVCVIVGPTKTGKTEFAMAQCGKDTLVVNCHNVVEPDLRKFAGAHIHKSLILDEGGPKMLEKHRDLLQASKRDITLGHSGTNRFTYTVNLYRVKIIITSNEWYDELEKLSEKDQAWVRGNTVMIDIDSPTWETDDDQAIFFSMTNRRVVRDPYLREWNLDFKVFMILLLISLCLIVDEKQPRGWGICFVAVCKNNNISKPLRLRRRPSPANLRLPAVFGFSGRFRRRAPVSRRPFRSPWP